MPVKAPVYLFMTAIEVYTLMFALCFVISDGGVLLVAVAYMGLGVHYDSLQVKTWGSLFKYIEPP